MISAESNFEFAGDQKPGSDNPVAACSGNAVSDGTPPLSYDPAGGLELSQPVPLQNSAVAEAIDRPHPGPLLQERERERRFTTVQIEHGTRALAKYEAVQQYRAEHPAATWAEITRVTKVTPVEFCRWGKSIRAASECWAQGAAPDRMLLVEALAKQSPPGRKPRYQFTAPEAKAVKAHVLQSNRTSTAGSPEEAVRHALKRQEIGSALAAELQQRAAEGKPLLTEAMRRQIEVGELTTQAYRTPRNAWLNGVQSPGSLQLTRDEETGEERMFQPGEAWTIDDGTINFICCVPLERPGDKCWDKFGVMVGRWQFILIPDHRSYYIVGFSYTARPRGSYRAEDLTSAIHIAAREHGMPRVLFMEQGISKSRLVHETMDRAGIKVEHVKSPHQKVVEGIFNKLWTKLSFQPGQVGRFMGDDEEVTKLLMACRRGEKDPREHFLMLDQVVAALREAISEHNNQLIEYSRYGKWIPREFWEAKAPAQLRRLDADSEWMFSPVITQPLTVRGFSVKTTVKLMDGLSQVFHFGADFLQEFHGARVKVFFDPFVDAPAKIVLAENFHGHRAETILGNADMTDRHARYNLRKLGYGAFPDIGLQAARQHAQALRRAVVAIRPDGRPGITAIETRTGGTHNIDTPQFSPAPKSAPAPATAETAKRNTETVSMPWSLRKLLVKETVE